MNFKLMRYTAAALFLAGLLMVPVGLYAMDKSAANADGMLAGAKGHRAKGKVMVEKSASGHMLTMNNIKVDKVPDGYVYLAKDANHTQGVNLGMLKQFKGNVQFKIPAGTDLSAYNSVVIWCEKYSVEIGRAYLPPYAMQK